MEKNGPGIHLRVLFQYQIQAVTLQNGGSSTAGRAETLSGKF